MSPADTYVAQVIPVVGPINDANAKCAKSGCHTGTFAPNMTSFATLDKAFRSQPGAMARFVTHGAHTGPALSAADAAKIATWIDSVPAGQ